jgi:hypothetical protein
MGYLTFIPDNVYCVATDTSGNSAPDLFVVSVVDTTPPILNLPPDITVETSNPQGISVTYVVTATDIVDPNPLINCTPASGNIFPIGSTAVSCIATDGSGNQTPGTFTITVNQFYRVFMPIIRSPQSQTTQINPPKTVLTPKGLNPVRSSRLFGKPDITSGSLAKIIPATQELNYQNGQGFGLRNVPLQYPDPMPKPNSKVIGKVEMLLPIQRGKERGRDKET